MVIAGRRERDRREPSHRHGEVRNPHGDCRGADDRPHRRGDEAGIRKRERDQANDPEPEPLAPASETPPRADANAARAVSSSVARGKPARHADPPRARARSAPYAVHRSTNTATSITPNFAWPLAPQAADLPQAAVSATPSVTDWSLANVRRRDAF